MEMGNVPNTIGSQFLITLSDDNGLQDMTPLDKSKTAMNGHATEGRYLSLGSVTEDANDVLSKLNRSYCDDDGRPFADIRIQRVFVVHDPFEDSEEMKELLSARGVDVGEASLDQEFYALAPKSPDYERPPEESVPHRIQADDTTLFATEYHDEEEEDEETRQKRLEMQQKQEEEWRQREDTSRAVMLEMLGDLPSAEIQAPENVLFVCKLNPITNDEDLELIFSRFDQNAKAEIIRDPDTGDSLQYAFVEFGSNEACNEAYLKMNNALVDDRRIKVDFSQSVAKVWDRYHKRYRQGLSGGVDLGYKDAGGRGGGRGRGRGRGRGGVNFRGRGDLSYDRQRRRDHGSSEHWIRKPSPLRMSHSERQRPRSNSNSPYRQDERSRSRSSSYSSERNRKRRHKRSSSPSKSRSRSKSRNSSESRHRRRKKKHRHHDRRKHKHKHHSRKEKKKRKRHHRNRSRDDYSGDSRERSYSRSASPLHERRRGRHDDKGSNGRKDDEDRSRHDSRAHHDRRR